MCAALDLRQFYSRFQVNSHHSWEEEGMDKQTLKIYSMKPLIICLPILMHFPYVFLSFMDMHAMQISGHLKILL